LVDHIVLLSADYAAHFVDYLVDFVVLLLQLLDELVALGHHFLLGFDIAQ
jgi:hypothetical protein